MKKKKIKQEEEIIDKKSYRNFMILFYRESKHYKFEDVMFNLRSFKYFAYIEHEPEEDEKVSHFHAFIRVDSATTCKAIANRLGIPDDKVSYVKNIRGACRYLTHIDYPEKIQYSLDQVFVSGLFKRKYLKNFEDIKTEEEIIDDIYFFIDNNHYNSYSEKLKYLIMFVNLNCYDTVYKRYRYEFLDYLKMNL